MTRRSTTLGAFVLTTAVAVTWVTATHQPARAQAGAARPAVRPAFAPPEPMTGDPALASLGTATAAAADGQGSVVLAYPNGVVAVVKPSGIGVAGGPATTKSGITVYRVRLDGMVEKAPFPPLPPGR